MALNNRTTLNQFYEIVAEYIIGNKIATDYTPTTSEFTGLLDKIGKQVTMVHNFYDSLPELDGEMLPLGKTIEEWYSDLKKPVAYDEEGSSTLARRKSGYRKPYYSYKQPRMVIENTIPYNVFEAGSIDQAAYISLVNDNVKKFADSIALARYGRKKKLLNLVASKIKEVMTGDTINEIDSEETYKNGEWVWYDDNGEKKIFAVMEDITTPADLDVPALVSTGKLVELHLETKLARPTDNATGTAFVKALKDIAESLQFARDGHCLSGATIGSDEGVVMYLRKGIASVIDVDVLAGAFHQEKVAVPIEFKVVEDDALPTGVYALLVDRRMIRLHPTYQAIRQNENGQGDFINQFSHTDYTAFYSMNTYCHIFTDVE